MNALFIALAVLLAGVVIAPFCGRRPFVCRWVPAASICVASAFALRSVLAVFSKGGAISWSCAWSIGGTASLELDPLSAFFLALIFIVAVPASIYGAGYLAAYDGKRNPAPAGMLLNGLIAAMMLVVLSRNAVLFLFAWEAMALTSFGLVMLNHEKGGVVRAGWSYLAASQFSAAMLFLLFAAAGSSGGGVDFAGFANAGREPGVLIALFVLSVAGFGTKAGLVPFHVWLPEAHPAAPSHVSAVMSGAMIKMGLYGLIRTIRLLGALPPICGWILLFVGILSGMLGIVSAMVQRDMKRALAYSSVENVGIAALGIALGMLGAAYGRPGMAAFGWTGALLHMLNHAVFKGLLFMSAGVVLQKTHTVDLEHLGGLARRMKYTAAAFAVGAVAISGLPPLNGFHGEFLLYAGAVDALLHSSGPGLAAALAAIVGLSLIGGLALACFTRLFSTAFLGQPRTACAESACDPSPSMFLPVLAMAAMCVVLGAGSAGILPAVRLAHTSAMPDAEMSSAASMLGGIVAASLVLVTAVAVLCAARWFLLMRREVRYEPVWDCGYAAPTVRMQYTATSFAQPLAALFSWILKFRTSGRAPNGSFPTGASWSSQTPDVIADGILQPISRSVVKRADLLKRIQHGNIHLYILYIALTLLALLVFKLHS